jgi:hypothetical protein
MRRSLLPQEGEGARSSTPQTAERSKTSDRRSNSMEVLGWGGDLDWGSVSTLSTTTSRCSASCPSGRCVLRYPGGGNGKQRDMARPRRAPPDQPSGGTTRALLFCPPQSSPLPPPSAAAGAVLGSLLPGGRPRGPCAGGSHPRRRRRRNRGGSGRAPRRSEREGRIRPPPDRAGSESGFRCDLPPAMVSF